MNKHIVYKIKKAGVGEYMHHDKHTFSDDVTKHKVYESENSVYKVEEELITKGLDVEVNEFYLVLRDTEAEEKELQEKAAKSIIPETRNKSVLNITTKEAAELMLPKIQQLEWYDKDKKVVGNITYSFREDDDYFYEDEHTEYYIHYDIADEMFITIVPIIDENSTLRIFWIKSTTDKCIDSKGREDSAAIDEIEIDLKQYIRLRENKSKLDRLIDSEYFYS